MVSVDQIEFRGLIGNRPLQEITAGEFANALGKGGWRRVALAFCQCSGLSVKAPAAPCGPALNR